MSNKVVIIIIVSFFLMQCNQKEKLIKDNKLIKDDELINIAEYFVNRFKIEKNSNILISENDLSYYFNNSLKLDTANYVYLYITNYSNEIPYIDNSDKRELQKTEYNEYTIFYEVNKNAPIRISNNLKWNKVNTKKNDEIIMVVDYIELQCLYNLKLKRIEFLE